MLSAREKSICLMLAKQDMNRTRVRDVTGISRPTIDRSIASIKVKTGLDPRRFFDLRKLVDQYSPEARKRLLPKKVYIPDDYRLFIQALADCNMKVAPACTRLYATHGAGHYWIKRIKEITGLNPKSFLDLEVLYDSAKEE